MQFQPTWIHDNHLQGSIVAKSVHGPFIHFLIKWSDYEDHDPKLASDWAGFGLVGHLPYCGPDSKILLKRKLSFLSVEDLIAQSPSRNRELVASARPSEWDEDLMYIAPTDAELGFNSLPRKLSDWFLDNVTLCRRIPVREEKVSGWRTRPVDDESENAFHNTVVSSHTTVHDGLLELLVCISLFFHANFQPTMWKRDEKKAFRQLLV